jgi:hypothetical protein
VRQISEVEVVEEKQKIPKKKKGKRVKGKKKNK